MSYAGFSTPAPLDIDREDHREAYFMYYLLIHHEDLLTPPPEEDE